MGHGSPGWEHVGHAMRAARLARGLSRKQLVEKLGYTNINRGLRRLDRLEAGSVKPRFFDRLCEVLEPDPAELAAAYGRDRAAQEAWLDGPVPIELSIKWMACVFTSVPLPDEARHDPEAAQAFACELLRDTGRRHEHAEGWLVLSRRKTVIVDSKGRAHTLEGGPCGGLRPGFRIGGRSVEWSFGDAGGASPPSGRDANKKE